MSSPVDPGALLARYYTLPDGRRVRLRLVRPRDAASLRELFAAHDRWLGDLELARLVGFDITRRLVLVAAALIDARETVVGVGVVELGAAAEPAVLARGTLGGDLHTLLRDALIGHAATLAQARAA